MGKYFHNDLQSTEKCIPCGKLLPIKFIKVICKPLKTIVPTDGSNDVTAQKIKCSMKISPVNETKFAGSCGFGHIY